MATRKTTKVAAPVADENFGSPEDYGYLSEGQPTQEPVEMKATLKRVSLMAETLRKAQKAAAAAESALKAAKEELARIEEQEFPDLLREVGISDLTLEDGAKLSLVEDIHCGISEDRKPRAFAWLRKHNLDGVIKSAVIVNFDKGQGKEMSKLFEMLLKKKLNPEAKETIHPATLKSLLKEQRNKPVADDDTPLQKEAKQPPADVFAIFPYSIVKLKEVKK